MAEEEYQEEEFNYEQVVSDHESIAQSALCSGKPESAFPSILEDPPLKCKDKALKERNSVAVGRVLTSMKEAAIKATVDKLDDDQLDVLMKYIYRNLESGENSTILLKWHEIVYAKAGIGCIVRAISDRHTI